MTVTGFVLLLASVTADAGDLRVDADFTGGNLIVERIEGDDVWVHQDLRDTAGPWFWWHGRIRGGAGRTLRFHFTDGDCVGTRGPAVSYDRGVTWSYLGRREPAAFTLPIPPAADEVRIAFGIPYLQADLERFLKRYEGSPHLRVEALCRTGKGRVAERLRLGRLDGQAPLRVLLTARHHACESIADFVLEGLLEEILSDSANGRWYRDQVEVLAVPFVDKDGVEDGDQGKNRRPRDHNRDYDDPSVHATVRAIRDQVPAWAQGRLAAALDLHCPHIRGAWNEQAYFVGPADPERAAALQRYAALVADLHDGPVPFQADDFLPSGTAWNQPNTYSQGLSFANWARQMPEVRLAGTLEFPYANIRDWTVTPAGARAFGHSLAAALRRFLE